MYIPRIPHYIRDDTGDKSVMARRQESDEAISLITLTAYSGSQSCACSRSLSIPSQ